MSQLTLRLFRPKTWGTCIGIPIIEAFAVPGGWDLLLFDGKVVNYRLANMPEDYPFFSHEPKPGDFAVFGFMGLPKLMNFVAVMPLPFLYQAYTWAHISGSSYKLRPKHYTPQWGGIIEVVVDHPEEEDVYICVLDSSHVAEVETEVVPEVGDVFLMADPGTGIHLPIVVPHEVAEMIFPGPMVPEPPLPPPPEFYDWYMWGNNDYMQAFLGAPTSRTSPVQVDPGGAEVPPLRVTGYWPGATTSFVQLEDGTFRCLGYNQYGALGVGPTASPVTVPIAFENPFDGSTPVKVLVLPNHWNIVVTDGGAGVYVAGRNNNGQLGLGDKVDVNVWTALPHPASKRWVNAWGSNSGTNCAVDADGDVYMWGYTRVHHQIAGYTTDQVSPVLLPDPIKNVIFMGNGGSYGTMLVTSDNRFFGSGTAPYTGLPSNNLTGSWVEYIPAFVAAGATLRSINYGLNFCVAIASDGTMWSFGVDNTGCLGLGPTPGNQNVFTQIGTDTDWDEILIIDERTVFVTKLDGTVWYWGNNADGRWGIGEANLTLFHNAPTLHPLWVTPYEIVPGDVCRARIPFVEPA